MGNQLFLVMAKSNRMDAWNRGFRFICFARALIGLILLFRELIIKDKPLPFFSTTFNHSIVKIFYVLLILMVLAKNPAQPLFFPMEYLWMLAATAVLFLIFPMD